MGNEIIATLAVTIALLLIGILGMAFKPLFIKGGKFPNIHIGGSKAMKERGINCATSQDREARQPKTSRTGQLHYRPTDSTNKII